MEKFEIETPTLAPARPREWRGYDYYSRYPAVQPTQPRRRLGRILHRIGFYMRLSIIGAIVILIGGVFPLITSYELFLKPLVTVTCSACQIVRVKPYFEFDYVLAAALGVLGFMMPIFVLFIVVKILRNRAFRRDLLD